MPDRLLRESIRSSENIERLTNFQEICFYRLIVTVADDGTTDARPKILARTLFPLRDSVRPSQITDALRALSDAELVDLFKRDGKPFLRLRTWDRHQNARTDLRNRKVWVNPNPAPPILDGMEMMSPEEARQNAEDANTVFDAAIDAGFPENKATLDELNRLRAAYGTEAVLDGIRGCVRGSVIKLNYLEGCCRKEQEKRKKAASEAEREANGRPRKDEFGREIWDDWS